MIDDLAKETLRVTMRQDISAEAQVAHVYRIDHQLKLEQIQGAKGNNLLKSLL